MGKKTVQQLEEDLALAQVQMSQLTERLEQLEKENEEFREAFRETLQQLQALRDFASPEARARWSLAQAQKKEKDQVESTVSMS